MLYKNNFCLGISKPLDILNKNIRKLINYALDKDIFIHTSILESTSNTSIKQKTI